MVSRTMASRAMVSGAMVSGAAASELQGHPTRTPTKVTPLRAMADTAEAAEADADQPASLLTGRLEASRLGVLIVIEDRTRVAAIERHLSQSRGEVAMTRQLYLRWLSLLWPYFQWLYLLWLCVRGRWR
jgi:hypothetical protein